MRDTLKFASISTLSHRIHSGASMLGSTIGADAQMEPTRYTTDALQKEMALTDMGLSAVYMHELRYRTKVTITG